MPKIKYSAQYLFVSYQKISQPLDTPGFNLSKLCIPVKAGTFVFIIAKISTESIPIQNPARQE